MSEVKTEFKNNSNAVKNNPMEQKPKEPKKIIKPVRVETHKKSIASRVGENINKSAFEKIGSTIFENIIVPTVVKVIDETITVAKNVILYGDTSKNNNARRGGLHDKVSYDGYYDASKTVNRPSKPHGSIYDIDSIIVDDYSDAMEILSRLDETIKIYGVARVADLYDIMGRTSDHTTNNYGWTDLSVAKPMRVKDGFQLRLPRVKPIR